jgi:hypothetical protein
VGQGKAVEDGRIGKLDNDTLTTPTGQRHPADQETCIALLPGLAPPQPCTPAQMAEQIASDTTLFAKLVADHKITTD